MRKRERQEKILSSTLSESLILFLFILLAITSIYKTKVNEYHKTVTENKLLPPGYKPVLEGERILQYNEKAIDKDEYDQLLSEAQKGNKSSNTVSKLQNLLTRKDKKIKELEMQGVSAPPCILENNNQVLFEVEFLRKKVYELTFKNLPAPRSFGKWNVFNGYQVKMNSSEFDNFSKAVIRSNRINTNDDFCCCEASKISSAYCTKCVYVFSLKQSSKKGFFNKKGIGEDLALEMHKTVLRSFYSDQK